MEIKRGIIYIAILTLIVLLIIFSILKNPPITGNVVLDGENYKCPDCNVILISIDTLRADHLGCYGYERNTSPYIDEFAKGGILFTDSLSQSTSTFLSLPSIFTSKYVFAQQKSLGNSTTLSEILRQNSYKTAAFTDGSMTKTRYIFKKGFNLHDDEGGHIKKMIPKTINWLKNNKQNKFFLFIHVYDVHCPYDPPEPYKSKFTNNYEPGFEIKGKCGRFYFNSLNLTKEDFQYISALYDGGIHYTDNILGQFFKEIDNLNLSNNTIIILTSDHGESLGEHNYIGHNELYEEQLIVPLIIKIPNQKPKIISEPVQSIDIFPTILGLLDIKLPTDIYGINLVPIMNGNFSFKDLRVRLSELRYVKTIRVNNNFKLVIDGKHSSLYNLKLDKEEKNNVIDIYPKIAESLASKLYNLINQSNIPYNSKNSNLKEEGITSPKLIEELKSLGYMN